MLLTSVLIIIGACLLDYVLGEPGHFHPLSGFGWLASKLEHQLNRKGARGLKIKGVLALLVLILPLVVGLGLWVASTSSGIMTYFIDVLVLYFAIGRKSLIEHANAIMDPLLQNNIPLAREKMALIVSRDTGQMNHSQIIIATLESIFENSNDALFGALFWFLLLGAPGALMYRLVNTLDAMWGYKNSRYQQFGWAAARLDDGLNWLSARLTVFSFSLLSHFFIVWPMAFKQGLKCSSKNGGPVMAAGAMALNIQLGGYAQYAGKVIEKPVLGGKNIATASDIKRAIALMDKALILWIGLLFIVSLFVEIF